MSLKGAIDLESAEVQAEPGDQRRQGGGHEGAKGELRGPGDDRDLFEHVKDGADGGAEGRGDARGTAQHTANASKSYVRSLQRTSMTSIT